jgi:DNA repair exonuclease SbcCD ATPase subunit
MFSPLFQGILKSQWLAKAKGGVKDQISIDITGAGGGFGYRALSKGQKRRVDVALLIALAKISHAAHGLTNGTLFFDEVFDPLDDVGIKAVANALLELSKDRCVVVITHSDVLKSIIEPTIHFNVSEGRIDTV